MPRSAQAPTIDPHVFLIGRPPLGEYLGFMRTISVGGHALDQGVLAAEWRSANDHLRALETQEAGLADAPPIIGLDPVLQPLEAAVLSDPIFRRTFAIAPTDIGVVELDRLV